MVGRETFRNLGERVRNAMNIRRGGGVYEFSPLRAEPASCACDQRKPLHNGVGGCDRRRDDRRRDRDVHPVAGRTG